MDDIKKTKQQLVNELLLLRTRVDKLEQFEAAHHLDDEILILLATFPEKNPNPIVGLDLMGHMTYANPAARRLFPTLLSGCCDHPWLSNWEVIVEHLQAEETGPLSREVTVGNACYLQTIYRQDSYIRIYGVDITAQKRVAETLRESENRYRELVQNANSAIIHWACDGTILFFNEYAETLFGYTATEIVGKNAAILLPQVESTGEDPARLVEDIVAHPEMFVSVVNENICRDGHRVWMTWTNRPIYDEQGRMTAILAVGIDITERNNAEQALLASEAKYRHTLDAMLEGCQILGFDWRYLYLNDAAERHNRRLREELLGKKYLDVWPCAESTPAFAAIRRCMEERTPQSTEYEFEFPDGSKGWFEVKISPVPEGVVILSIDTTERKRAELLLYRSQEMLTWAQEIAHLGSWELDLIHNRLTWSDETYGIFGHRPQEFGATYEAFLEIVHPEDRGLVDEAYMGSLRDGRDTYEVEHRIIRNTTGEIRYIQEKCEHQRDQAGRIIRSIGISHDITEHKLADMALRESERRFRRAIQEAPVPIMMHAEDGQVIVLSDAWVDLSGYTHHDIPTVAAWTQKAYGERHKQVKAEIDKMYGLEKKIQEDEFTIATSSGKSRIWDFSSTPLGTLPDGRRLVLSMAVDVTEQRQMEKTLRQHNEYLTALQETMLDLLSQLDLGNLLANIVSRSGQLMRTSSSFLGLIEPGTDKIGRHVGSGLLSTWSNDLLRDEEALVSTVCQTGKPLVVEDYRVRQNGVERIVPCSAIGVPLLSSSRVWGSPLLGVLVLAHEKTALCRFSQDDICLLEDLARFASIAIENALLVEALHQSNTELRARNEELDAFGHTVAHNLKNPLSSIIGFVDLLTEQGYPVSAESIRRLAPTLLEMSLRMDNIIEQLMLLAGLRKKTVIEMQPLDMAHIVTEAQRRLAYLIDQSQAKIISPSHWPEALGYASWVEEIWINYISNAIKYGGQPPSIKLGAAKEGKWVRFWVQDNGAGLTQEQQSHLFQPFERLGQTDLKGHGLGLSIVRRIVERMGGKVRVDSDGIPGKGCTFCFTLPAMRMLSIQKDRSSTPGQNNSLESGR